MAAYVLTRAGANVLLLEAGGPWDNTKDSVMLKMPYESPRRGASTPDRPFGEFDACIGGWDLQGEPFTNAEGTDFKWWRARMVGGRTNHWGRISLRFGPEDFKAKSRDGLGDDWPIGYSDLAPYYDRIDKLIGVFGNNDNLPNHPGGYFLPPPPPRCYELMVKDAADRLNIWCVASRLSVITKPHNGRMACHYCGQCNRGCRTNSNFSSTNVLIAPALKTGRLTLITNAMAREVTVNNRGLASGVTYGYDFLNRLTSATGSITLKYDGDGNRVQETVGSAITNFLVDDTNPTGYPQVVEELVGGVVQRQYTYGHALISQNQAAGVSFYGMDAQHNPTLH